MKTILSVWVTVILILTTHTALALSRAECVSLRSKINKLKRKNCVQSEHAPGVQFFLTPAEVQCVKKNESKIEDKCYEYEVDCVNTRNLAPISACTGGGRGGRFNQLGAPMNQVEACDAALGCRPGDSSRSYQYHFDPNKDGNRVGDTPPPGTTRTYIFGDE